MNDREDEEEGKALTEAVLTARSQRTSEQWALIERAKSRNARNFGLDLDSITWDLAVETVVLVMFSLLMTPKLVQLVAGTSIKQMGMAAFFIVPIAWAIICVVLGAAFGLSRLFLHDNPVARIAFGLFLGLILYLGLLGAAELKLSPAPESAAQYSASAKSDAPPPSLNELRSGVVLADIAMVDRVLASGVSIDARNEGGETSLMLAVALAGSGRIPSAVVRHLLDRGASINLRDHSGHTALTNAAGSVEVIQLLAAYGANPNLTWQQDSVWEQLRDKDVKTVIAIADKFPDVRVPVDLEGIPKKSPVQVFAERGDLELVRYFLGRGLSARNTLGNAISGANERRRPESQLLPLVELLLQAGDHPNLGGAWGALQWAGPYPAVVQRLIDAGANVNAVARWYEDEKSVLDLFGNAAGAKVLRAAGGKTIKELRAGQR